MTVLVRAVDGGVFGYLAGGHVPVESGFQARGGREGVGGVGVVVEVGGGGGKGGGGAGEGAVSLDEVGFGFGDEPVGQGGGDVGVFLVIRPSVR